MAAFYYQLDRESGHYIKKEKHFKLTNQVFNKTIETRHIAKPTEKKTSYIGVYWVQRQLRWRAEIMINKLVITLGHFTDPKAAALAYDKQAIRLGRKTNILKPINP